MIVRVPIRNAPDHLFAADPFEFAVQLHREVDEWPARVCVGLTPAEVAESAAEDARWALFNAGGDHSGIVARERAMNDALEAEE